MKNIYTFKKICDEWLEYKKLSIKYSSYVKYDRVVHHYLIDYFGDYGINDISTHIIIQYFQDMLDKEYASSTLRSIRYVFKSVIQYSHKKYETKLIDMDFIRLKRKTKSLHIINQDEKRLLDKYIFTHYEPISLAIMMGLYAGLRLGEVSGLQWKDIDIDNQVIYVSKTVQRLKNNENNNKKTKLVVSAPKTVTSKRIVPLPIFVVNYIRDYQMNLKDYDEEYYFFSNEMNIPDPRNIQYHFSKICQLYDIEAHFHTLRHTYATYCVMSDIDIKSLSEMLGHSHVSITLDLYVHSTIEFKKEQIKKIQDPTLTWNF